jgi:hypothetical protein
MFQDMMIWFRDFQGLRDLDVVWFWVRDLFIYYWSTSPIITILLCFVGAVVILTGTERFKLFGNSLLSIVTTLITSSFTFVFQTIIKNGTELLVGLIVSSYQRLVKKKK